MVEIIEAFSRIDTRLALIIIIERLRIDEHGHHSVSDSTLDQILQRDAMLTCRLGHVPQLILQIVNLVLCLDSLLQFRDDLSEEHIYYKSVDCALVEHVQDAPEVVQRLRRLLVFHGQNEVKEGLVVHLTFERLQLLEHSINENVCQSRTIPGQFCFVEHAIFVLIQLQVLVVDSQ